MTNSSANVHAADSSSIVKHQFPWKWYLSDLDKVQKNGKTVFSCFSCGGGSSMGYKLAGYDVIGCCEIDPRVMTVYQQNNHPKYPYLMDVCQLFIASKATSNSGSHCGNTGKDQSKAGLTRFFDGGDSDWQYTGLEPDKDGICDRANEFAEIVRKI